MAQVISLKDRFFSALYDSKSFKLLSQEQQVNLVHSFSAADDEKFLRALQELENHKQQLENAVNRAEKRKQQLAEKAQQLEQTLREAERALEKEELKAEAVKEELASAEAAELLLKELPSEPKPKKKKWFWGLF